jgi:methylmalonyl-CoA/ethylmalonyl-CoA epimerase
MSAFPEPPVAARFDHVALAVPRIVDALPIYRDLLGGRFYTGGDNPRLGYRGVQLAFSGGKVEILEPLVGSGFLDSFLATRPLGGLHHLTYIVEDLAASVAEVERAGFEVHGEFTEDARWQEVFVHPKRANGVLLQFAQTGPGYGPDNFGLEQVLEGHGNLGSGIPSPGYEPTTNRSGDTDD